MFRPPPKTNAPALSRTPLRLLALAALALPVAGFLVGAIQQWKVIHEGAGPRAVQSAQTISDHTARTWSSHAIAARGLLGAPDVALRLQAIKDAFPEVETAWITEPDGSYGASTWETGLAPPDIGSATGLVLKHGMTISVHEIADGSHLAIALGQEPLESHYRRHLPPDGSGGLIASDGTALFGLSGPDHPAAASLATLRGGPETVTVNGSRYTVATAGVPGTDLVAAYVIPHDALRRHWLSQISLQASLLTPGLFGIAWLGWLATRRQRRLGDLVAESTSELRCALADRSEALQERELLLREIHHRVKNNMQIVSSIVRLQGARSPQTDETIRRIQAMALVHELVYASDGTLSEVDIGRCLQRLCTALATGAPASSCHVAEVDPIRIEIERAVPFALAMSEALSACFRTLRSGERLTARLWQDGDFVRISIQGGSDGPARMDPFGEKLLRNLSVQIGGETAWDPVGAFSMSFPIAAPTAV